MWTTEESFVGEGVVLSPSPSPLSLRPDSAPLRIRREDSPTVSVVVTGTLSGDGEGRDPSRDVVVVSVTAVPWSGDVQLCSEGRRGESSARNLS